MAIASPSNARAKMLWLAGILLTLGLAMGGIVDVWNLDPASPLVFGIYIGIVFSQICLLAIWVAFGRHSFLKRMIGLLVAGAYFSFQFGLILDEPPWLYLILVSIAVATTMVPFMLLRVLRFSLVTERGPFGPSKFQFSIRQLLFLTLLFAFTIGIGKWLWPSSPIWPLELGELVWVCGSVSTPFSVMAGIALWAALGRRHLVLASLALCGTTGGIGLWWHVVSEEPRPFWLVASASEALVVVTSLLVIRSCGYRLVRIAPPPKLPPGHDGQPEAVRSGPEDIQTTSPE